MQAAGMIEVEAGDGDRAVLDRGHLVHAWRAGSHPPLIPAPIAGAPTTPVPPDVLVAEEAHLLWRWITSAGARLVAGEGALALPVPAVSVLTTLEAAEASRPPP
jgi:hypothetical protein